MTKTKTAPRTTPKTAPKTAPKSATAPAADGAKADSSRLGLQRPRANKDAKAISGKVDQMLHVPPPGAPAEPAQRDATLPEIAAAMIKVGKQAKAADELPRGARICWLGGVDGGDTANVAQPGSARHKRIAKLREFDGRTVGEYLDAGGLAATVLHNQDLGHLKLDIE
jgi:hypothetical protein